MANAPTSVTLSTGQTLYTTDASLFAAGQVRYDYAEDQDELMWSKYFPYQLAVLRVSKANNYSSGAMNVATYSIYKDLIFTLPINPESLGLSMPFAINTTATQGGVSEQHGGAPFRDIVFSGTLGVVFDRPSADKPQDTLGTLGGIAAGTLSATTNFASSTGIGNVNTSNLSSEEPGPGTGDIQPGSTGYYQFRVLQRFLESYAEAKKTADGTDLRLALLVWKENAAYICSPQLFDVTRTAQSPYEYRYSLRLRAWRRINPRDIAVSGGNVDGGNISASTAFSFNTVHGLLQKAIVMSTSASNVLRAIRADADKLFDSFRLVSFFCAITAGIPKSALSLPKAIRVSFESAIRDSWENISTSFDGQDQHVAAKVATITQEVESYRSGIATATLTLYKTLSDDQEAAFHDLIKPDSLNLNDAVRGLLDQHVEYAYTLTSDDFRRMADQTFAAIDDYADVVGLNDATYDKVMNRVAKVQIRDATLDDYRLMHSLADAAFAISTLATNAPSRDNITVAEYVAGLANQNGLSMRVPRSKFAVPFPYGGTLELLAQQYLGDTSRWGEIAALNNLTSPWVDEAGQSLLLIVNGHGNIINVSDASTMRVGQMVRLWSDTVVPEKRKLININKIGATQYQITVDGANDLAKFKVTDHAGIQWFLWGTVNSQQIIYIPSDSTANDQILKYVPGAEDIDAIITQGNVDGLLSESGDLTISQDGDWPMVTGLAALIQWARTALNTPIKALALHPDFGVDPRVGQSIADADATDILKSLKATFRFNPSFSGVQSASVERTGPTTKISMELGVQGVDVLLPLSFVVE